MCRLAHFPIGTLAGRSGETAETWAGFGPETIEPVGIGPGGLSAAHAVNNTVIATCASAFKGLVSFNRISQLEGLPVGVTDVQSA